MPVCLAAVGTSAGFNSIQRLNSLRKETKTFDFAGEERWYLCAASAVVDYTIENRELS